MNIKKIWEKIKSIFQSARAEVERLAPTAVDIVQAIKSFVDSPIDDLILDIVKKAIPGTADDALIDKAIVTLKTWLPIWLRRLELIENISKIKDVNEQMKAILAAFEVVPTNVKATFYKEFAGLVLEKLSDGKLSRSECIELAQKVYNNRQNLLQ